jgi:Bacterial sugar transferase
MNVALPLLWLVAFGLASGYDARFIGTRSGRVPHDPERRGELAAAIAISSCEINIQLSRDCLLVALPSTTLFDLPQLWNVLLGEMSLVGPCPALPDAMTKSSIMSDVE